MLNKLGIKMSQANFDKMKEAIKGEETFCESLIPQNLEIARENFEDIQDDLDDWRITAGAKKAARWVGDLF